MSNSTVRVIEILNLLASSSSALTISEISKMLDYPKSSVFDVVSELRRLGYLRFEDELRKTYTIGVNAYQMGQSFLRNSSFYSIAHTAMSHMEKRPEETLFLAIPDGQYLVYVDKIESSGSVRPHTPVGHRSIQHRSALGRAMLAGNSDAKVVELVGDPLTGITPFTEIRDLPTLLEELDRIRRRGYSIVTGERTQFMHCVAAPIRAADESVRAAISVCVIDEDFAPAYCADIAGRLTATALTISHQLGYTKNSLFSLYD